MKKAYTLIVSGREKRYIDRKDVTIAIDTIRCNTTIIYAFKNGVETVIPARTIKEARRLAKITPNSFLAGERQGIKARGFEFSNSPTELESSNIEGKRMIITTSYGTKLIKLGMEHSKTVLIGAINNAKACSIKAHELSSKFQGDIKILIPWIRGGITIEDFYTAGLISGHLLEKNIELNFDTAKIGKLLTSLPYDEMMREIKNSWSAHKISEAGYEFDVDRCLALNETNIVPYSKGKRLIVP